MHLLSSSFFRGRERKTRPILLVPGRWDPWRDTGARGEKEKRGRGLEEGKDASERERSKKKPSLGRLASVGGKK